MFSTELILLLVSAKVNEELEKYSANISGVPYFVVGDNNLQFMNLVFWIITQASPFIPLICFDRLMESRS